MMSPNDLILANMPEGMRREKVICPNCNNISNKANYCNTCGNRIPS